MLDRSPARRIPAPLIAISGLLAGAGLATAAAFSPVVAAVDGSARSDAGLRIVEATAPPATIDTDADLAAAESLSRAFTSVSERVSQSVVSIRAIRRGPSGRGRAQPGGGEGSGFVVRPDGYLVTNNHVVEEADRIFVSFDGRRRYQADVVGLDPLSDLAVLKVDMEDLPSLALGTARPRVGQWVVAAGNPFGIGSSITAGIVSATGRGIGINRYEDYIQTDAAINPGNSGGPLLDLRGRVVGVNTAILSRTGGNVGIGFAIPADLVADVVEQLITSGEVRRGYLGVQMVELTDGLAARLGYAGPGVVIDRVPSDGPAARGGLQVNDIITGIDGEPTASSEELRLLIARKRPGQEVTIEFIRDGRELVEEIALGDLDRDLLARNTPSVPVMPVLRATNRLLGMSLEQLDPEIMRRLGVTDIEEGVLVSRVMDSSPAAAAGVEPGTVITAVGDEPVRDVEDWARIILSTEEGEPLEVTLWDGDTDETRVVMLPRPALD